jgi:hypothetical protein
MGLPRRRGHRYGLFNLIYKFFAKARMLFVGPGRGILKLVLRSTSKNDAKRDCPSRERALAFTSLHRTTSSGKDFVIGHTAIQLGALFVGKKEGLGVGV